MGLHFEFAKVPHTQDGDYEDIFTHDHDPKPGVEIMEAVTEVEDISLSGFTTLNNMTSGALKKLCGGETNSRFVLLQPRAQYLESIIRTLRDPPTDPFYLLPRLEAICRNATACLERYGEQAAMIIE